VSDLPSGLPDQVGLGETLARFLLSHSHFSQHPDRALQKAQQKLIAMKLTQVARIHLLPNT